MRSRSDLTLLHFNPLSTEEIKKVEFLVNNFILNAVPVTMTEMPIEEAKKLGAMMLFGEKYGDIVRVVRAGDFSTEFCGGTHVSNSGQIGLFKIVSESSVAAGVRRITAVTGAGLLAYLDVNEALVKGVSAALKTGENEVQERVNALMNELKDKEKEIKNLNAELAKLRSADAFSKPISVCGLSFMLRG